MNIYDNKYSNWYFNIIRKAQLENRFRGNGVIYERHHITPKSLGGTDDDTNLVLLTLKEHFVCHLLLPKMLREENDVRKMLWAVAYFKLPGKYFNSRLYEAVKTRLKLIGMSKEQVEKMAATKRGVKRSAEANRKTSMTLKSKKIVHGKMSEETKNKIRETKKRNYVLKLWMNKDGKQIKVLPEEVDYYISLNWKRGINKEFMTDEYKQKLRNKTNEQWQKVKETGHVGHLIKVSENAN